MATSRTLREMSSKLKPRGQRPHPAGQAGLPRRRRLRGLRALPREVRGGGARAAPRGRPRHRRLVPRTPGQNRSQTRVREPESSAPVSGPALSCYCIKADFFFELAFKNRRRLLQSNTHFAAPHHFKISLQDLHIISTRLAENIRDREPLDLGWFRCQVEVARGREGRIAGRAVTADEHLTDSCLV